jgi:hypothetical protein
MPAQHENGFWLPDDRNDELEKGLVEVRALIESSLALHRNRNVQESLISRLECSHADVLAKARELLATAGHGIDIIHAVGPGVWEQAAELSREKCPLTAAKDVPVRLIAAPHLLDAEESVGTEPAHSRRPVEVRLACVPPLRVLIVDNRVVLSETSFGGIRRVTLIRVPEVVHAIGALFQSVWSSAVPAMNGSILFDTPQRSDLARRILRAMHAGAPDEVAARELHMSVRTYGRYVAEIMAALGANSRFQAGVRAAEAGLLAPGSSTATAEARDVLLR